MKYALIGGGVLILVVAVVLIATHKPKQANTPPPSAPNPTPKAGGNANLLSQGLTVADDILNLLHKPSASVNTPAATNIPAAPSATSNAGMFGMGY